MSELESAASEMLSRADNGTGTEPPRKRGRPPGSKNRPKDTTNNGPLPKGTGGPENKAEFTYVRDENSVQATRMMGETVWWIASNMLPVRPLNEEESVQLAEALDPVLCKWIPIFGDWKYELSLLMCILALYSATKVDKKKSDSSATIEDADATGSAT